MKKETKCEEAETLLSMSRQLAAMAYNKLNGEGEVAAMANDLIQKIDKWSRRTS